MTNNIKEKIQADLQEAKATGQLRTENIREIVKTAVSQIASELKEGSSELRTLVKDAVSTVIENLQDKGGEIKEEVTVAIEGALEAVNTKRHDAIVKTQTQLKRIQAKLDDEEEQLQQEVEGMLTEIEHTSQDKSANTKTAIASAINGIQDSEEVALLKKRYAHLQAQVAIIRANLAARYGGRSVEIKEYLEDAQTWYNQAHPQAEMMVKQVEEKHSQLDNKLGELGVSIARKERGLKQSLRELLLTTADLFKDKEAGNKETLVKK
jgi:hypothetical protein